MIRFLFLLAGLTLGTVGVLLMPGASEQLRTGIAMLPGFGWVMPPAQGERVPSSEHHHEGEIVLTEEQITAAGIEVAEAQAGVLKRILQVPGTIVPSA